jgi:hypothetical protein
LLPFRDDSILSVVSRDLAIWLPALRAARIAMFSIGCIWFFPQDVKEQFKAAASIPKFSQKGSGYFLNS